MPSKKSIAIKIVIAVVIVCLIALCVIKLFGKPNKETEATPDEQAEDTSVTPTEDDNFQDQEPIEEGYESTVGLENSPNFIKNYDNSNDISCKYNDNGDIIHIGAVSTEDNNSLYLNISCSASTTENPVGFYIASSRNPVVYDEDSGAEYTSFPNVKDFYLLGETYDTAIPAMYNNSTDFGCKWTNDSLYDGKFGKDAETTLYIKAVGLRTHKVLAVLRLEIGYDETGENFYFANLSRNDVAATKVLSESEITSIVDASKTALFDSSVNPQISGIPKDAVINALIEKIEKVYFSPFFDSEGNRAIWGSYFNCDVYAVNINLNDAIGNITFYFAPAFQLMGPGMSSETAPGETERNLTLFGYTSLVPWTIDLYTQNNPTLVEPVE